MKVVYSPTAQADLDDILDYTSKQFPGQANALEARIGSVIDRVATWPESAELVDGEPGVRVVPVLRYPFLIFYRQRDDVIEIIRIRHAARQRE